MWLKSQSLVWFFSSSGRRVNRGSGRAAATMSPLNVSSWKPGAGELPSCSSGSRTRSHFTQCTKTIPPLHPLWPFLPLSLLVPLSLSLSLHQSITPPSLRSFPIPFPSLPPLFLPSGDTPTHWAEPVPLDLCCSGTSCRGSGGQHLPQLKLQSCFLFQRYKIEDKTRLFRNTKRKKGKASNISIY